MEPVKPTSNSYIGTILVISDELHDIAVAYYKEAKVEMHIIKSSEMTLKPEPRPRDVSTLLVADVLSITDEAARIRGMSAAMQEIVFTDLINEADRRFIIIKAAPGVTYEEVHGNEIPKENHPYGWYRQFEKKKR